MTNKIINGDCLEELKKLEENSIDAIVTDPPYGLSFMGKKWDYDVPSVEIWSECLRVLKPGGYLLSFAGTRTQHRMAVRIEDSGFEIRDMIAWMYGSGFPKSLNIGKAVDKLQGNERELTKGTSEWEGWGTALKPALEPITVARKPLSEKTVALNCLKWGVGGMDIDGSRVGTKVISQHGRNANDNPAQVPQNEYKPNNEWTGRFPANLIHDGSVEVLGLFPMTKSQSGGNRGKSQIWGGASGEQQRNGFDDSGSASRFFYCAKASKSERNRGCEGMEEVIKPLMGEFKNNPGRETPKSSPTPRANFHPTVKPIALMEYLVKLVSREGALVLDPFAGSGSTGIACQNLNRNFILIEREPAYIEIIKARCTR